MSRVQPWPKLRDASSWRGRPVEERAQAIEKACRAALELLAASPDRAARLRRVDPVPPSTRRLLQRLAARNDA